MPTATTERIQEYAHSGGMALKVDRDKCMVFGVKVLGLKSQNDGGTREYTPKAIAESLQKYEGAPVFVDHQLKGTVRSYHDRNGRLVNVKATNDGIFADHNYNPKHPITEQYLWDAENCPANVGFSHDIDGVTTRSNGKVIVESIATVRSVDMVARPATTQGLFEGEELPSDGEHRRLAEHGMSAMSDARTILLGEDTADRKRYKLRGLLGSWITELYEGEIGDTIADQERREAICKINGTAMDLIRDGMWDDDYPTVEAKKARVLSVLADWEKEINALPSATGTTQESVIMEWKDISVEALKEHRQDLVATLTDSAAQAELAAAKTALKEAQDALAAVQAEKAEQAKALAITEEIQAAKLNPADKRAVSDLFLAQLKAAPDAAVRKQLLEERVALLAVTPAPMGSTAPFAPVGMTESVGPGASKAETLARL